MTRRSANHRGKVPLEQLRTRGGVALAAAKPATPPKDERGTSGSVGWGGIVSGLRVDYAEAWKLPKRWETTEKMRTDPAVSACLSALTYPILAAELKVEPASDDPEDKRLAEFVDEALKGMTISLSRHRMQVLGYLDEGVRVFETIYERREDDLWWPRKIALRPNRTIGTNFHLDDHGGPDGVTQTNPATGKPERLDMDRLLIFTHLGDDSIIGRPATRAMYRPWFLIDKVSRIGAIAIERHGVGIPWARYTGNDDTERDKIDQALMDMHANEALFFRIDGDVPEWGVMGVEGTMLDPVPFMEYQRRDLFLAPLAQFLVLGTDGVGAQALSRDHSGLFMLAEGSITQELDDTYNSHLVPRLIGYNWTVPADRLPRVKHGTIDQRNALEWAQAVAAVVQAGVQLPQAALTHTAAQLLGVTVPEVVEQPADDVADVNDPNAPEASGEGAATAPSAEYGARRTWPGVSLAAANGQLVSVVKMEALGIAPDFVKMAAALDKGRDRIIERVGALQSKQARRVAAIGTKLAKAGDAAAVAAILAGANGKRLVPFDEEAAAFADEMAGLYGEGASDLADELDQQGVKPQAADAGRRDRDKEYLAALALVAAALLADRMQVAWAAETMRQMRSGTNAAAMAAAVGGLSAKLLESLASQSANTALATGRAATGSANAEGIDHYIYSCVNDVNSCGECIALDGQEFAPGDEPALPLDACLGGDRCRCSEIPVAKSEG